MRDVGKEVVAVAFSGPKVKAMLDSLLLVFGVKILAKAQHHHFAGLELKVFTRQKDLVAWNEAQDPLVVLWQLVLDGGPNCAHRPWNVGFRLAKKAWTPSA